MLIVKEHVHGVFTCTYKKWEDLISQSTNMY